MKKIISILVVLSLLTAMTIPVFAEDTVNEESVNTENGVVIGMHDAQKRLDMILALIGLRGSAVTSAEIEKYSARLEQLGVTTLEDSEIVDYLETCGISLFEEKNIPFGSLPTVETTNDLWWDVYDMSGYYYPELNEKFDVYFIMASPRNSNSYLWESAVSSSKDTLVDIISNGSEWWLQTALSAAADEVGLDELYSVFDLVTSLIADIDPVEVREVGVGDWTLQWTAETYMAYLYVRDSGSQSDYEFAMSGCKVYLTYVYTQYIEVDGENGKKEADYIVLRGHDEEFMKSSFGNVKIAVDAYRNGTIKYNIISYVDLNFFEDDPNAKETIRIYPSDWRQNPSSLYWERIEDETS